MRRINRTPRSGYQRRTRPSILVRNLSGAHISADNVQAIHCMTQHTQTSQKMCSPNRMLPKGTQHLTLWNRACVTCHSARIPLTGIQRDWGSANGDAATALRDSSALTRLQDLVNQVYVRRSQQLPPLPCVAAWSQCYSSHRTPGIRPFASQVDSPSTIPNARPGLPISQTQTCR